VLGLLAAIALSAGGGTARAQAADTALAESLFQEGKRLMNEGKPAEACPKLAESYRLDPGLGTLLNLATCHEAEGKIATAWAEFNEALSRAKREADTARADFAAARVSALAPRLSRVVVTVSPEANLPGLEVTLNGSRIAPAAWGLPVPVDPGTHEIAATAPGKQRWSERRPAPREAQTETVRIPLLKDAAAPAAPAPAAPAPLEPVPPPAPRASAAPSRFTPPVIIAGAAAGLFTVGAVVTGVLYSGARSDYEEANEELASDRTDKRDEAQTLGVLNLVCLGGAVVSAGVAVALYATGPSGATEAAPKAARLEVAPLLGPGRAGLGARGRF
jgi:hypothetical protein